jgi:hypothetical protein
MGGTPIIEATRPSAAAASISPRANAASAAWMRAPASSTSIVVSRDTISW